METHPHPPRKNWFRRHPAWTIGIAAMLAAAALIVSIFLLLGTTFHDSDAFHLAVAAAEANPAVMQKLGSPIETGRFVGGNMEVTGETGHAEMTIPISGPRGHGDLYARAVKNAGGWRLIELDFDAEGQASMDILPRAPSPAASR